MTDGEGAGSVALPGPLLVIPSSCVLASPLNAIHPVCCRSRAFSTGTHFRHVASRLDLVHGSVIKCSHVTAVDDGGAVVGAGRSGAGL